MSDVGGNFCFACFCSRLDAYVMDFLASNHSNRGRREEQDSNANT